MKYNCLIADDKITDRDLVALYLSKLDNIKDVQICSDGKEAAVTLLTNENIDIVFSDIDMPGLTGIGLLKGLKHPAVFIFITSYAEYAVESFDLDVIDFIVKPLTFERFQKAFNKATEYIQLKKGMKITENKEVVKDMYSDEYFFIRENHNITKLFYADVLYIESMGDFSKIFTIQDDRYITLVSLKNLEKQLPDTIFRRVHKQFIANVNHITTISVNDIQMNNKQILPLSATYKQTLVDQIVNKKIMSRFPR